MNLHGSRVAVIGASGQIGRFLVPRLVGVGAEVMALSRRRPAWSQHLPINWLQCSMEQVSAAELGDCAAIIWVAPLNLFAEFASRLGLEGVQHVVAFSSTSVLTKQASTSAAERQMSALIAQSEGTLVEACDKSSVNWTLLRPTLIYGAGEDLNISRLRALVRRFGVLPLPIDSHGLRQPVHADDLAHACIQVLRSSRAIARTYALPGGETLSYRALATKLFQAESRPVRILPLPRWLLAAALHLRGEDPALLTRMAQDLVFDSGPAAADFGYTPRPFNP